MSVEATTRQSPAPAPRPPRYPATYWALVIGFGVSRIGAVLVPYLTLYLVTQLHLSTTEAGQVLAAFGTGWILGQPLAGTAADRLGRKTTIVASLGLTAAAYTLLTQATTVPQLLALAAAIGLVFDGSRTAITAWIADLVPEADRSRGYGLQYWMLNAGGALSGVLGGYLASSHLTALCMVDALTCVGFALVVTLLPGGTSPNRPTADPIRHRDVLGDRRLLTVTVLSLITLTVYQQMMYGLPLTIRANGLSPAVYGAVNVTNAIAVLALQPPLQPVMDRLNPLKSCAIGSLAIGAGMGANALTHTALGFAAAAVLWTIGEITFCVGASTYVASLAPDQARGRYLGIWGIAFGGSAVLAPLLGAAALAHGPNWLWGSSAAIAATCAAAFAAQAMRPEHRRTEATDL
ncbi:MFS transporter [Streptacidiphilus sp. EB103A]|uniref:MFS transporter n=1 Tax=Streptacidiphilus sp. EB103A TaxID=3156275 RepID=UPI003514C088